MHPFHWQELARIALGVGFEDRTDLRQMSLVEALECVGGYSGRHLGGFWKQWSSQPGSYRV